MARTTVFRYKGQSTDPQRVGKELGVGAVLTGKVFQRGDALLIRADLVKAADGSELWGEQYNRKLADVFAVQEEIAKEISEKLRSKLTGAERQQLSKRPTNNLKAFQYYMLGRTHALRRTREDLNAAIQDYQNALTEDPKYALAYAGLADASLSLGVLGYIAPIEGRRQAEDAARKALSLDETLPEAHVAAGQAAVTFAPSDFLLGDRELQQAIRLSPSLSLAYFYMGISFARQGRIAESLKAFQTAHELDPLSSLFARCVALPYYLQRDYSRALQVLRDADHLGTPFNTTFEAGIYLANRSFDDTLTELIKAREERPKDPIVINAIGILYAGQGKRLEAGRTINDLQTISENQLDEALWIAKIYSVLDEKEPALTWLQRGADTGAIGTFYKDDPIWDPIRSDPRFGELLKRLGLPQ